MYQVVGKVVNYNNIVGFVLFNYENRCIDMYDLNKCMYGIGNRLIINLEAIDGCFNVTDGVIYKLPIYNTNGYPYGNNLPVILERVVYKGVTFGYTLIDDKGKFKKCKTNDLISRYTEFYNAKVVNRNGNIYLSAKKGDFITLELKS